MRAVYYTGIFLVAAVALALILLILFPQAFPPNVAATFGRSVSSEPQDRPSPFEEKQEPATKKAPPPPALPPSPEPAKAEPAPVEPAPNPEPPKRFPVAQDIAKGMSKSAIVEAFGLPEATVSGADGQLRERLVYVDKNSGRKTFVLLANGSVSSVETVSQ